MSVSEGEEIRLITLAPGHFHAALVQKRMLPGIAPRVAVYAPLDRDLSTHVQRIALFNTREEAPTCWELDIHAGPDWREQFAAERPGNVVVIAGRNSQKLELMAQAISLGLNVLADKPWVIRTEDLPRLDALLAEADARGLLVWDMMTERYEVTNRIQRELTLDPEIFGSWLIEGKDSPALEMESVHHLRKYVAGQPLQRPWWWFDVAISGPSFADVGTHLVDLALGMIASEQPLDHQRDVEVLSSTGWPLMIREDQFAEVTGLSGFPPPLKAQARQDQLAYAANNSVYLRLRGVHARLTTRWEYESAQGGGDLHHAIARGTRATIIIHQDRAPNALPEISVIPQPPQTFSELLARLRDHCQRWENRYPGLGVERQGDAVRFLIPPTLRTGHEAHFAEVLREFIRYFQDRSAVPAWERSHLLAKYALTTRAVAMAEPVSPCPNGSTLFPGQ